MTNVDTKDKILNAAEELFVKEGISETSLRGITAAAGVNVAAVNYHFGGKEALIRAIFQRTVEPVNRNRLERLDALEVEGAPTLERVLDAFYRPAARLAFSDPERAKHARLLYSRIHAAPSPALHSIFMSLFSEVAERFMAALERCTPELSPQERSWNFRMTVALLVQALLRSPEQDELNGLPVQTPPLSEDEVVGRLVTFAAAGWRASNADKWARSV